MGARLLLAQVSQESPSCRLFHLICIHIWLRIVGMVFLLSISETCSQTWHIDVFGRGYWSMILPFTTVRGTSFAVKEHQVIYLFFRC
jgi:hypothetical protein